MFSIDLHRHNSICLLDKTIKTGLADLGKLKKAIFSPYGRHGLKVTLYANYLSDTNWQILSISHLTSFNFLIKFSRISIFQGPHYTPGVNFWNLFDNFDLNLCVQILVLANWVVFVDF